jgi:hypothetical protein
MTRKPKTGMKYPEDREERIINFGAQFYFALVTALQGF